MFMNLKVEYCKGINSSQVDYRFNLNKNPSKLLIEIDKLILKFIQKYKGPKIPKIILKNKEEMHD